MSHVSTVSLSHFSSVAPVLPMTYLAYDLYSLFSFNRPTLPPTYNLHVTCLHCSIVLTPPHAQVSRGCRWADQVPECSTNSVVVGDQLKDHTIQSCDQIILSYYHTIYTLAHWSKDPCLKPLSCTKYCRQDNDMPTLAYNHI